MMIYLNIMMMCYNSLDIDDIDDDTYYDDDDDDVHLFVDMMTVAFFWCSVIRMYLVHMVPVDDTIPRWCCCAFLMPMMLWWYSITVMLMLMTVCSISNAYVPFYDDTFDDTLVLYLVLIPDDGGIDGTLVMMWCYLLMIWYDTIVLRYYDCCSVFHDTTIVLLFWYSIMMMYCYVFRLLLLLIDDIVGNHS